MRTRRFCLVVESGVDVRLIEGLAEHLDVSVIARRTEDGREISWPPPPSVRMTVGPASRVAFAAHVASTLLRRSASFDVVLVQGYGLAALAANVAAQVTRRPTFMVVCSPLERYYACRRGNVWPGKPFRRRHLWGLRAVARVNAHIGQQYLVLSNHLARVVGSHGVAAHRIHMVPVYGVDTNVFRPSEESKRAFRERLDLPAHEAIVFFSSRVAPEKDAASVIDAVKLLAESGRPVKLLHLSGAHGEFLALARERGVADRVIARDAVHPHHALPPYYQASDLCVQASREEGLGFSPLEALACEVPVVASAVGALVETIVPGRTGWNYAPGDAAGLARQIAEMLDQPGEAQRRAKAGRQMVLAGYDRKLVFDRLLAVCGL